MICQNCGSHMIANLCTQCAFSEVSFHLDEMESRHSAASTFSYNLKSNARPKRVENPFESAWQWKPEAHRFLNSNNYQPKSSNYNEPPPPPYTEKPTVSRYDRQDYKPQYEKIEKVIRCWESITYEDIWSFLDNNKSKLDDNDRKLLQAAAVLVAEESSWIFKNARILVRGMNIRVEFVCGNQGNEYVIQPDGKDLASHQISQKNLRLKIRDGFKAIFTPINPLVNPPALLLSGAAMA